MSWIKAMYQLRYIEHEGVGLDWRQIEIAAMAVLPVVMRNSPSDVIDASSSS